MDDELITVRATFSFTDRVEETYEAPDVGPRLTRVTLHKRYNGPIVGIGVAQVLTAQCESGAGYVASERISGSLEGCPGTFVIQHVGVLDRGSPSTHGSVVPGSGTDQLAGIAGTATEDEEGVLTLKYTLADRAERDPSA
jgi:hypothetical protein